MRIMGSGGANVTSDGTTMLMVVRPIGATLESHTTTQTKPRSDISKVVTPNRFPFWSVKVRTSFTWGGDEFCPRTSSSSTINSTLFPCLTMNGMLAALLRHPQQSGDRTIIRSGEHSHKVAGLGDGHGGKGRDHDRRLRWPP